LSSSLVCYLNEEAKATEEESNKSNLLLWSRKDQQVT